jgi:hypothetical protein
MKASITSKIKDTLIPIYMGYSMFIHKIRSYYKITNVKITSNELTNIVHSNKSVLSLASIEGIDTQNLHKENSSDFEVKLKIEEPISFDEYENLNKQRK